MKTRYVLSLVVVSILLISGCSRKTEEAEETETTDAAHKALQQFADKARDIKDKGTADPVNFRELKALLPEKAAGLKRTEATGEKSGAMGFVISRAEARYGDEGDGTLHIEIFDTGGIAGIGTMALATWTMADIDKETATGYEKTTTLEGYKGFEKYDSQRKSGELNVLVADRFVVNINGNGLSMSKLKDVLSDLDLDKLSELK